MDLKLLENTLIKNNIVDVNSIYFKKYIDIVSTSYEDTFLDKHHIIPRCYFKYFNDTCCNDIENIVLLPIDKHIIAHYYLYKCSKVNWFTYANLCAIKFFTGRIDITEKELEGILPDLKEIGENARILNSNFHKGENHHNYGKHLSEETKKKISESHKGLVVREGFHHSEETKKKIGDSHRGEKCYLYGKHPSEDTRLKMSSSRKGKKHKPMSEEGRKNISESHKNKTLKEETKKKIRQSNKGKHSYFKDTVFVTNGKINKRISPLELESYFKNGFREGYTRRNKLDSEV